MSLHERHLPINLPLHDFSFPNQLHSIHNPNLCCCIHLLSIFKRCCNWLLAQHMFPSGNGQQGLLLETWSKQCSMLIEWSMDIISNCNTTVQVLKEQSPVLVKGCDGANVNNINIWVFYEVFVAGSSFGNAMTFRKPEASNHSYFTLAKGHFVFRMFWSISFLDGHGQAFTWNISSWITFCVLCFLGIESNCNVNITHLTLSDILYISKALLCFLCVSCSTALQFSSRHFL